MSGCWTWSRMDTTTKQTVFKQTCEITLANSGLESPLGFGGEHWVGAPHQFDGFQFLF